MALSKVRVQLLNEKTGEVIEEVDVLTSPDSVLFADGKTLTQVLALSEADPQGHAVAGVGGAAVEQGGGHIEDASGPEGHGHRVQPMSQISSILI